MLKYINTLKTIFVLKVFSSLDIIYLASKFNNTINVIYNIQKNCFYKIKRTR
jgi:hypothetical protein